MLNMFYYMLYVPWLHVKYIFNGIQNTKMYVKCIGTPQKVTTLQLNLQLNEHNGLFIDEN
jgi:hypothetical protein